MSNSKKQYSEAIATHLVATFGMSCEAAKSTVNNNLQQVSYGYHDSVSVTDMSAKIAESTSHDFTAVSDDGYACYTA